ncbi:MAG: zinc transport system substrate-binding protein [Planctomycetota bacterium]|jgi:zinc transport system substrate-binding protein
MIKVNRSFICLALALTVTACGPSEGPVVNAEVERALPIVLATNYPLAFMAERLAGEFADVNYPGPVDIDPATWQPDRDMLRRFQEADLILLNGPAYSPWIQTLSLPLAQTIDTTEGFRDRWIERADVSLHSHGPEGASSHGHLAFTTWLDPALAIEQSAAITSALIRLSPANQDFFSEQLRHLTDELKSLDDEFLSLAHLDLDRPLLASHPVYDYLARKLSLNLRSVHFEPDQLPSTENWLELDKILFEHPARVMIWEDTPLPETVRQLADRGLECFTVSPAAAGAGSSNFLEIMVQNARHLKEALTGPR